MAQSGEYAVRLNDFARAQAKTPGDRTLAIG
jgi:hypothetical protein